MTANENNTSPFSRQAGMPFWEEKLTDGTAVTIRAVRKEDATLEREFITRLSPEARRMRFLCQISQPSDQLIDSLTNLDFSHDMALIAIVKEQGKAVEVGVSRYATGADRSIGECAIAVADEWQHRGLGTLLMQRLVEVARERGLVKLVSMDDAGNSKMRQLANDLGFQRIADPNNPHEVEHSLVL
ncbi:N-acetyltransferase family protein [Dokdonella sp.]|uniref:GNAT family N-acetyltransferase n=1 Tax=Dokdonella sp. TaxID=2291710 RepID=UPI003C3FA070